MSIFIITPAYEGKVTSEYMMSVMSLIRACWVNKIEVEPYISNGGSLITKERNNLLALFMQSQYSHLLMIDADTALVEIEKVIEWHNENKECICAASPTRPHSGFQFHVQLQESKIMKGQPMREGKYYYVKRIGCAYMLISREAILKLQRKNQQRKYINNHKRTAYDFFSSERIGETYYGEDYMFCKHMRDANIPILLDHNCTIIHSGIARNIGNFAKHTGEKENA